MNFDLNDILLKVVMGLVAVMVIFGVFFMWQPFTHEESVTTETTPKERQQIIENEIKNNADYDPDKPFLILASQTTTYVTHMSIAQWVVSKVRGDFE